MVVGFAPTCDAQPTSVGCFGIIGGCDILYGTPSKGEFKC